MKRASSLTKSFSLGILLSAMLLGACTGAPPSKAPETSTTPSETTETPAASPSTSGTEAPSEAPIAQAPSQAPNKEPISYERPVEVYWLTDEDNDLGLMSVPMGTADKTADPAVQLKDAMEALLAGPEAEDDRTTTIPAETQLNQLDLKNDGVHVDLSADFTTGGGSLSMTARVAQILYTATSSNPEGQVWLKVDGEPLDVLGGEGIILQQPLTREYFEDNFDL